MAISFRLKSVMTELRPLSLEKVAHGNVTNLKVAAKQTWNQNQVSWFSVASSSIIVSEVLDQKFSISIWVFSPQDDEYLDDKDSDLTAAKNLTHLSISVKNDIINRFGIHAAVVKPRGNSGMGRLHRRVPMSWWILATSGAARNEETAIFLRTEFLLYLLRNSTWDLHFHMPLSLFFFYLNIFPIVCPKAPRLIEGAYNNTIIRLKKKQTNFILSFSCFCFHFVYTEFNVYFKQALLH